MTSIDTLIALLLAVALIVAGYKVYLFPQKYLFDRARSPVTTIDRLIPFRPNWVWIYSGIYYPFWVSPILIASSYGQFLTIAFSYFLLLVLQMAIAHLFPVKTPKNWRQYDPNNSLSERFLGLIQRIDKGGNAFPSMHVGIAVLTALHIVQIVDAGMHPNILFVWVMPVVISISTLFTKQHLIVDVPAGAALGLVTFEVQDNFPHISWAG